MSCLFDSLSYFIGENSDNVRQKICDYLQSNLPVVSGMETCSVLEFENQTASNYIIGMRSPSNWGGAIEIQAACNIWKMSVNVRNNRDSNGRTIEFIPIRGESEKTINIYWTGGHYEPVR